MNTGSANAHERSPEADAGRLSNRGAWLVVVLAAALLALVVPVAILAGVRFSYTLRVVTLGGLLLGGLSGAMGSFAVLRKQSLLGDALSHAALPGVGIAFLLAGRDIEALLVGAAVASLLGVWVLSLITRTTRIKQDAAMGIVLAGWFAIGIAILAFIQQRPDASQAGLDTFIFGQAAAIVERDVRLLAFITAATVLIVMLNWKELKLVTFDPDFAKANGFRVSTFTVLLLATIVVAVVVGLQLAGVVLMVGLLIAPGIAARQWTNTLEQMVVLAAIVGATAGVLGAIVSAVDVNVPTGPMIIIAAFLFVLVSLLFAPGRGVIWSAIRRRSDRRRYAAVNVRKTTLRYADGHEEGKQAVSEDFLVGVIGKSARTGINKLVNTGELLHGEDGYELSGKGRRNAQKDEDLRRGERYGGD